MNFTSRLALYGGIVALLLASGVVYVHLPARRVVFVPRHPQGEMFYRSIKATPAQNEIGAATRQLKKRALPLLAAGRYAELDEIAATFRKSEAAFADGTSQLGLFYNVVTNLETDAPEAQWQTRLDLVRRWFEEDAESITARVAMARLLVGYAWHARGSNWAHDVPKDAWRVVHERIVEANRILEAARTLSEKCPVWYSTWMFMAMLEGPAREQYDEMFAEALMNFPKYTAYHFLKVWFLQERWHGEYGDWQAFATESADRIGGEEGDVLYARIVWYVHDLRVYGNPIAESRVQWERVERGFETLRRRYPDSLYVLSEYCAISGFAPSNAKHRVRVLLAELNNRVDLMVWRKIELFQRDQSWALSGN